MSKPFVVSGFWLGYAGQVQYRAKRNLNRVFSRLSGRRS